MNDIKIRLITKDDVSKLAELYNRVWPGSLDNHFRKAKWAVNTTDYPGVCAEVDGKIVGSRSCFRTNTYCGQDKVECVQVGDSCVDNEYRGKGLFTKMNMFFLDNYYKLGGKLIYNFSVEASKRAYEKIGWNYIQSMSNMIYINHPFRFFFKILKGFRSLGDSGALPCEVPDISVVSDNLLAKRERLLMGGGIFHTRYDRSTLEWRLGTYSGIRILNVPNIGVCLYKKGITKGVRWCTIGEIFLETYNQKSFNKIINKLKGEDKFDIINVCVTHSHPLFNYYKRHLFVFVPRRRFLNHGIRVKEGEDIAKFINPNSWALSTIDIDTF